jgi:uncharacterized protein (DUF305 family)
MLAPLAGRIRDDLMKKESDMSMRTRIWSASIAAVLALAGSAAAVAQEGHGAHGSAPAAQEQLSSAAEGYREAMDRMHEAMNALQDTGDADVDFARGMIPHHQAAIDMARIVLQHGKDAEIRKLAEEIIEAQEREIAQLNRWLESHAK